MKLFIEERNTVLGIEETTTIEVGIPGIQGPPGGGGGGGGIETFGVYRDAFEQLLVGLTFEGVITPEWLGLDPPDLGFELPDWWDEDQPGAIGPPEGLPPGLYIAEVFLSLRAEDLPEDARLGFNPQGSWYVWDTPAWDLTLEAGALAQKRVMLSWIFRTSEELGLQRIGFNVNTNTAAVPVFWFGQLALHKIG